MAADLNLEWISLPRSWTYGITRGGRVFFINEEAKSTTWLHPVTGEAVVTGHRRQSTDLPTGWEEAYTFEGARYYINHNERKVTCKHPVTGQPSQDNCIFVVNEQTVATMTSEEKKERPISMINEASNYNVTSDYAVHPMSPVGRTSRASKKVHNFGKRSNSIKRNPNAPVVRRGWLYKQDSTGMKLWKKRWFVLSDLCLFYYRDEKEEGILGSILLPSFQIALLTSEDHINRKYAFKAAHPNMRTYYFCTDTGKEMELWMKAMLDAALVQTEPVKRVDKITSENAPTKESNNIPNHRVLIKPEIQNNQKNKEMSKIEEKKALEAEKYGFQKDGQDRPLTKINSVKLNSLPSEYESGSACPAQTAHYRPVNLNSSENKIVNVSLADLRGGNRPSTGPLYTEADRVIQRTNSMQQLEQWIKIQKGRGHEEETRGVISYQTLPRNMPSHRAQIMARYPEGYRTLPRNSKTRPESICSVAPSTHDKTLGPGAEEKRRSMRDDTMWQLYEWQQRQFYNKQSTLPRHSTLSSPKTMVNISDQTMHSIPTSPSHGSIAAYQGYSPQRTYRSEVSSPIQRGDVTIDRRHRAHHPKLSQDEGRGTLYKYRPEEVDIDAKLSRLCEQDKVVHALEEKLQQLHKEKYTLEQALLSASQEIEMHADNPAAIQTVVLQRDDLQNGLLSTCRELSRATAELERAWREYDKLEYDVTVTRNQMQEQLDHLGEVQTESAGIQRAQIQKELWRIQDVMEGLSKHKQQRGMVGSKPFSTVKYKSEGPDYRLYKSEPELTTVAEVDESNGEEKSEPVSEIETSVVKGSHFPVGVVPPRTKSPTPESSTIASYVTLRKTKKMMDLRTERPRSAVEQLCLAESTRPRMTVEEQMERIRRHQQACLREKKKGLNVIGASDQSPLQSPSNLRDNPFRTTQTRRKDDNVKELDIVIRENDVKPDRETPTAEIVQLKETEPQNVDFSKELKKTENISYEMLFEPEPNGVNSVEMMDKEKMPEDVTFSPQDETQITNHKPEDHPEENTKNNADEQEETVISYESTPEVSRGNQTMAVKSLSPSPESSASPVPSTQPQLTEGSHFMCV
ncbi:pleckstrin homology domain-containing family A member 5 isoform X19 [Macaca thibetana thibetana]|uniref:pleckstrin homology domain-containing family A member 5 isoform X19 n=1 Tax=Macaca thibetana thibetana TaxID=257877 RepID=UPI001E258DEC|nr:pleckstrin homology domain-containing family A member 5 isoform X19 [Macaca fascicularis]XP_050603545.1 pleckstrin homology domain-containing family A member 5 isoform X19 [Macaca thibetana thibetana]